LSCKGLCQTGTTPSVLRSPQRSRFGNILGTLLDLRCRCADGQPR
jgi:hypothetical protein